MSVPLYETYDTDSKFDFHDPEVSHIFDEVNLVNALFEYHSDVDFNRIEDCERAIATITNDLLSGRLRLSNETVNIDDCHTFCFSTQHYL